MKSVIATYEINQPSLEDYNAKYVRMPCNTKIKEALFDIISTPKNINEAIIFTTSTGSSPIAYYENKIQDALDSGSIPSLNSHEKQFVGSVTCMVMENNGWKKTGRKQRFSKGIFKSAEIYVKK